MPQTKIFQRLFFVIVGVVEKAIESLDSCSIRSYFVLTIGTGEETMAYIVFAEEVIEGMDIRPYRVETIDEGFARILFRMGYSYHFLESPRGWTLMITGPAVTEPNGPQRSMPRPMTTSYKRPRDARYDLIEQAVDGRINGHVCIREDEYWRRLEAGEDIRRLA